jgi:hypothetical protein
MHKLILLLLALASPMFMVSCGNSEAGTDLVKMASEAGNSLKSVTEGLTGLAGMEDVTKITDKVKELLPNVESLNNLKAKLGDKMPNLDGLKGAVEGLKSKFSGNEAIMNALKPLMDKVQALFA